LVLDEKTQPDSYIRRTALYSALSIFEKIRILSAPYGPKNTVFQNNFGSFRGPKQILFHLKRFLSEALEMGALA